MLNLSKKPLALALGASFALAGFAGGILVPNQTLSAQVGSAFILYAFLAVVIGGLDMILKRPDDTAHHEAAHQPS